MKLAQTLLVHNTADILEENLIYHLNRGVDVVLAIDDESTDGSSDVLESFVGGGWVVVVSKGQSESFERDGAAVWRTRLARLAATEHGADWVISGDPDEFWWPVVGDLKETLALIPEPYEQVLAPRTDFVFERDPVRSVLHDLTIRESSSPLAYKVALRASADVVLDRGSHRAAHDVARDCLTRWEIGRPMPVAPVFPLRIFHFAITSQAAFERAVARAASPGAAWRRDALSRHGGNKQARQGTFDPLAPWRLETLEHRLAEGTLVVDERFACLAGDLKDPRKGNIDEGATIGAPAVTGDLYALTRSLGHEGTEVQQLLLEAIQRRDGKLRTRAQHAIQKHKDLSQRGTANRFRALFTSGDRP